MVVSGLNGGCFCQDFGSVQIAGVQSDIDVLYRITYPGSTDSFSEHYAPNHDGIVNINDLGTLAYSYFPLLQGFDSGYLGMDYSVTIEAEVTDASGETATFSQRFHYAGCRTRIQDACNYRGFLCRHKCTRIHDGQSNYLSWFQRGQFLEVGVAWSDGQGQHWNKFRLLGTGADTGNLLCYDLSLSNTLQWLASAFRFSLDPQKVDYMVFFLKTDEEAIDTIQVDCDHRTSDALDILYLNAFGVPETVTFRGRDNRTVNMEADFVQAAHRYRRINVDLSVFHDINSGYITRVQREAAEDLACSRFVRLDSGEYRGEEITITDIRFEETSRPRTEPINVSVKFRISHETQRIINRDMSIDYRIFDHTFEEVFE